MCLRGTDKVILSKLKITFCSCVSNLVSFCSSAFICIDRATRGLSGTGVRSVLSQYVPKIRLDSFSILGRNLLRVGPVQPSCNMVGFCTHIHRANIVSATNVCTSNVCLCVYVCVCMCVCVCLTSSQRCIGQTHCSQECKRVQSSGVATVPSQYL